MGVVFWWECTVGANRVLTVDLAYDLNRFITRVWYFSRAMGQRRFLSRQRASWVESPPGTSMRHAYIAAVSNMGPA